MPGSISNVSFLSKFSAASGREYKCTVQLLDDSDTFACDFKKHDLGQAVFDKVCDNLELVEKDYFGLRYMDLSRNRYWLDLQKPIFKQIHGLTPIVFCLRVRYYPADPTLLAEEITRYQLFLQLRRDMLHGRLYCPHADAAYLGACVVQSEVGDYDACEHADGYVSEYKLFLKQTAKLEDRVAEAHKSLAGQTPADAEMSFLRRSAALDTYGFDPYTVKDMRSTNSVYVGVTHQGVLVYQASRKMHHVRWDQVDKVDYVGKQFRLYPKPEYFSVVLDGAQTLEKESAARHKEKPAGKQQHAEPLKYLCPSATFAKHLWRHTLNQKAFFTCDTSAAVKPVTSKSRVPVLLRGATFRYSGRVLHEIAEAGRPDRPPPSFVRFHVERQPGRADRAYPWAGKYGTLPRLAAKKDDELKEEDDPAADTPKHQSTAGWVQSVVLDHNENRASEEPPKSLHLRTSGLDDGAGGPGDGAVSPVVDLSPGRELRPNGIPPFGANKTAPAPALDESHTTGPHDGTRDSSVVLNAPGPCDTAVAQNYTDEVPAGSFVVCEPRAESTPIKGANGYGGQQLDLSADSAHAEPASDTSEQQEVGGASRAIRSLLVAVLACFIVFALLIALMEVADTSANLRSVLDSVPGTRHFRHLCYEPLRRKIVGAH